MLVGIEAFPSSSWIGPKPDSSISARASLLNAQSPASSSVIVEVDHILNAIFMIDDRDMSSNGDVAVAGSGSRQLARKVGRSPMSLLQQARTEHAARLQLGLV